VPDKMVKAIHAFLEFCYIAWHDIHDTNSLVALDDALWRFHRHWEIFRTSSVHDGFNLTGTFESIAPISLNAQDEGKMTTNADCLELGGIVSVELLVTN
jgi:hypothetical protein